MKIIRFDDIAQVPASHEDPKDPGTVKRVLIKAQDEIHGTIQMINWAILLPGKTVAGHFHHDMQELFIMLQSGIVATIENKKISLGRGDALVVDAGEKHEMKNPSAAPIEYIVVGIA